MNRAFAIRGVIPPLFTPFVDRGDGLDEEALRAHVQWLIEKGVHGLMPCGTTGEGVLLSPAERRRVLEVVVESAAHRVPVIAHVGTAATAETVELARHAQTCGVEAVSVVTPYYFQLPDSALVAHYCRVAEAVADTPVFLYNIPHCTGNALSRAAVEAIVARCPNVVGIKDSSGNLQTLKSFAGVDGGGFQVVCGTDRLIVQALQAGACACVSGHADVFPEVVVGLFQAFWQGDWERARRQQEQLARISAVLSDGQPLSMLKRGLELRGLRAGPVRPPLPDTMPEALAAAASKLRSLQLLP